MASRILYSIRGYLPAGSLRARMAKGTFWLMCGTFATQALGLVSGIICARVLSKDGFGQLNLLRSTVLMLGVLAGTGLGIIGTKYAAEFRESDPEHAGKLLGLLFAVALVTGIIVTLASIALAPPIATRAMKAPGLIGPLRIASLLLLLNTLNGVQMGTICGFESFRSIFWLNLLDGIMLMAFIPSGALVAGVAGAIAGNVLAASIGILVKYHAIRAEFRRAKIVLRIGYAAEGFAEIARTVLPIMLLGVAFYPFEWLAKLSLAKRSDGFAQLGLFAAAYSMGAIASTIPSQLVSTVQPFLGNLLGKGEMRSFRRLAVSSIFLSGGAALIIAITLGAFSKYLMRVYGANFVSAWRVLVIMSFANVLYAFAIPYYKILIAYNKVWTQTIITFFSGATLIGFAYLLGDRGATGLALCYLGAYAAMFILQTGVIYRAISQIRIAESAQ